MLTGDGQRGLAGRALRRETPYSAHAQKWQHHCEKDQRDDPPADGPVQQQLAHEVAARPADHPGPMKPCSAI